MISPHAGAQTLQCAKLKLFDCTLGAADLGGDFPRAFLVHEAAQDHQSLIERQTVDELEQHDLALQHLLLGEHEQARASALEALRQGSHLENMRLSAGGIEVLGYLAEAGHEDLRAARLLGLASNLREISGAPLLRNFKPTHGRVRRNLLRRLGARTFQQAFQEGGAASLLRSLGEIQSL